MIIDNNIFISYDLKQEEIDIEEKWVNNLSYFLEILLGRLISRKPAIMTSKNLKGEDRMPIDRVISECSFFIIVMSGNQALSDVFIAETQVIVENVFNQGENGHLRIFKILKSDFPLFKQPRYFQKIINIEFFVRDRDQNDDYLSQEELSQEIEKQYWLKIVDLAYDIRDRIKILNNIDVKSFKYIYLAETTPDQQINRDIIKRELIQHGYNILPDKALPYDDKKLWEEINEYLKKCCLSVHIVGEEYGELVEGANISFVDFQNKAAADYFERIKNITIENTGFFFSRLIWMSPELKLFSEKQRLFVDKLKRDSDLLKGADVMETPIELLKSVIQDTAEENTLLRPREERKKLYQTTIKRRLYLIQEKPEQHETQILIKWFTNHGYDIILADFTSEKKLQLQQHREFLATCDAVLIYFEGKNYDWFKSKLSDVVKAPGYGRKKPFLVRAVYTQDSIILLDNRGGQNIINIKDRGSLDEKFDIFLKQKDIV